MWSSTDFQLSKIYECLIPLLCDINHCDSYSFMAATSKQKLVASVKMRKTLPMYKFPVTFWHEYFKIASKNNLVKKLKIKVSGLFCAWMKWQWSDI